MPGRPTKLTPETQERIRLAVSANAPLDFVAAFAGIDRSTLYRWLRRGARAPKGTYRDLVEAVAGARALAQARSLARRIQTARDPDRPVVGSRPRVLN